MRFPRLAVLAVASLAALAACSKVRAPAGEGGGSDVLVTIPGGGPAGEDVTVGVKACTGCHGDAGRVQAGADPGVAIAPPKAVSGKLDDRAIGAHQKHLVAGNFGPVIPCASCHVVPSTSSDHPAQRVQFRGLSVAAWGGGTVPSPTWTAGAGAAGSSCASTYCHGSFRNGAGANPVSWTTGAVACGTCHGLPPAGTHPALSVGTACADCHPSGYVGTVGGAPTAFQVDRAAHLNGALDTSGGHPAGWKDPAQHGLLSLTPAQGGSAFALCTTCHTAFGSAIAGDGGASSCDACHASPAVYGPYPSGTFAGSATWKTACTFCHGGKQSTSGAPPRDVHVLSNAAAVQGTTVPTVGAHTSHVGTTGVNSLHGTVQAIDCTACHPTRWTSATDAGHVDALTATVAIGAVGSAAATGSYARPSCSATYCHGNFRGGAGSGAVSWTFATSTLSCTTCHAMPPATAPHPGLAAGRACADCHAGYGGTMGGAAASFTPNVTVHVNGRVDVTSPHLSGWKDPAQHGLSALDPAQGGAAFASCTACHTNFGAASANLASSCDACHASPATYGPYASGTFPNHPAWKTECTFCHGGKGGDVNGAPPRDTHVLSNAAGVQGTTNATVGAHASHNRALHGLAAAVDCATCHVKPTDVLSPGHIEKATADVAFTGLAVAGGASPSYARATGCAATYCHGNFRGGAGAGAVAWTFAASTLGCTSCHGAPPALSATVPHPQNASCGSCHTGYTGGSVAAATHVDGLVQHVPATGCTQCHGDLTASAVASTSTAAAPGVVAGSVDTHGNTAVTSRGVGAHQKHLTGTTWSNASVACSACHVVPADGNTSHAASAAATVGFSGLAVAGGLSPVFTAGANPTCATTWCHGGMPGGLNPTMSWTATNAAACGSCHGIPPATVAGGAAHPANSACGTCHGGTYTDLVVDKALHLNGVIDGGGEPSGGSACSGCHGAIWNAMNGTTAKATRHALGNVVGTNDSPFDSGLGWTSPLSGNVAAARSCVNMCHGDHPHDLQSPVVATHEYNAYVDASTQGNRTPSGSQRTSANRARTDFDGTAANGGLCVSCHQNPVDAAHGAIAKAGFSAAAHNFTAASGATWAYVLHDGGRFARNCTKCHASRTEGTTPAATADASGSAAVHFGDDASLLAGAVNAAGVTANLVCFNCHGSAASPAAGAQGNRSGVDLQTALSKAKIHPAVASAVHDTVAEQAATWNSGRFSGSNRHANCLDCHDTHLAGKVNVVRTATATSARNQLASTSPLYGADGIAFGPFPALSATACANATVALPNACVTQATAANFGTSPVQATFEYQICFKCHSSFAFGNTTWPSSSASTGSGLQETDVAAEFSPTNRAGHPVVAGLGSYTGNGSNKALVAAQLSAPWNVNMGTQTMLCTDCHNTDSAAPAAQGPHGSAVAFMLAGTNKAWPFTSAASNGAATGTFFSLNNVTTGQGTNNGLFCLNCHPVSGTNSIHTHADLVGAGGQHTGAAVTRCTSCHVRVPHGGKVSRLLVTTNAPTRYKLGTPNFARVSKPASMGAWTIGGAATNLGSSCGQHSSTTPTELW